MITTLPILARLLAAVLATSPAQTTPAPMTGGGEVSIRYDADYLHVLVKGPRAGLASLCAADDSRVRILHASAALGEATYQKQGERWLLKSGFEWKLRDRRTTPGAGEMQVSDFLASHGWVANASRAGAPEREFRIRLTDGIRFLGVTFFTTSEPMAVSYWPAGMDDDCRAARISQGFLPEAAVFRPEAWYRVQR